MMIFMDLQSYIRTRKGFNYIPSYCSTGFDEWMRFNLDIWRAEITRGKRFFPGMNTIRIMLDWSAYMRKPLETLQNFGSVLDICGNLGIDVCPTIFNRWHDLKYDFGGIYYDQILDRKFERFGQYIDDIAGSFKNDSRIGLWDLCNEPHNTVFGEPLGQLEVDWLCWIAGRIRKAGVQQPITIGTMGMEIDPKTADLCDVLCIHPYGGWDDGSMEQACDAAVETAKKHGKPLIANETCQGSLSDTKRTEIVNKTLKVLKDRGIGWCAWTMHAGPTVSSNREKTDENCPPGDRAYMAFIDGDGCLRASHGAFNNY
jgi:hypothetical protein